VAAGDGRAATHRAMAGEGEPALARRWPNQCHHCTRRVNASTAG
jgi:hypothetical protein